ncbi:MAG: hypothetical protein JNM93_05060 [Bacteriovoracaceae bacterium]|nr:hypothetical protein [Bacteriovoracaceae bacterium]
MPSHPIIDHAKIWDSIDRLCYISKLSFEDFLDLIELTQYEYAQLRLNNGAVPLKPLFKLSNYFKITMNSIIEGQIDYARLVQLSYSTLREKYSTNAFSKCRSVHYSLYFIEKKFGWKKRAHILKNFQVTEDSLMDPDKPINLKLNIDIGNYFLEYFRSPELLKSMGLCSAVTNKNSPDFSILKNATTLSSLYEIMTEIIIPSKIEKNYTWRIHSVSEKSIYISGTPNPDIVNLLGADYLLSNSASLVREGFFSAVPMYVNLSAAEVTKIKDVNNNDPYDLYKITFEENHHSALAIK